MARIDFIHIPKNCGTSVQEMVQVYGMNHIKICPHCYDPKNSDPEFSMCILRDPVDRFISAFYYDKTCLNSNAAKYCQTPSDLIRQLRCTNYLISDNNHNIGDRKLGVNWIWTPQHMWDNNAKFVLFYENIAEDMMLFLDMLGYKNIKFPHTNKSQKPRYELSPHDIEFIKNYYRKDYEFIGRCSNQEWKNNIQ